jgi:hypothetical protein
VGLLFMSKVVSWAADNKLLAFKGPKLRSPAALLPLVATSRRPVNFMLPMALVYLRDCCLLGVIRAAGIARAIGNTLLDHTRFEMLGQIPVDSLIFS